MDCTYQRVNNSSQRDRETYPSEERAAGRSPVRSTANQAAKQHRGAWCFTTQRLVLAIRMQSMREQWKLRRQMSQELCSVATNDARPIPARSCPTHIRVDDPQIPTLGIGGFCYEGNIVFDIPGISTNVSYDNMCRSQICAIRKTFCKQRKCRAS